jgi:hypothetical protein
MIYPRICSARALDDRSLLVEFDNQEKRIYDITPLLATNAFSPLSDPALFKAVQVDAGGYAVVWNETMDISEYELWRHGKPLA